MINPPEIWRVFHLLGLMYYLVEMITDFKDRNKRPIYTGDIVMKRLGKYAMKSGGPSYYMVVKHKRGIALAPTDPTYEGMRLLVRASDMAYITVVDTQYREL